MITSGVNIIPEAPTAEVVALGRLAEDLGYDRCWVYDEGLATRDVHVVLAALAAATSRLELGTGITNPYTRHPATTAAAIASLDELSAGRAFLGLGAGGTLTLDPLGIDRSHPLRTVRDVLLACRRLLDGETVSMESPTFDLREARIGFPVRRGIEIWVAGRGPRMLALAGDLADGVMLDFVHRATLGDQIALVRAGATRDGHTPTSRSVKIAYSTMIVTDDASMAATRPHMTYRLVDSPPHVKEAVGIPEAAVARIRAAMADGLEAAAEHVRDEWVLPFVIAGTPTECSSTLGDLVDRHGIDEFLLPVLNFGIASSLLRSARSVIQGF